MAKNKSRFIFNMIAPVYGLFYHYQKRRTRQVIKAAKSTLDLSSYKTILDVGCGTGAVCAVLAENGFEVTGIDQAEGMLEIARRKALGKGKGKPILFLPGNVLESLPFDDKTFDVSLASYVAHGMGKREREAMYAEMSRITRHKMIIYDYNQKKSILTTLVERLEGGDYPNFIQNTVTEMRQQFPKVDVIQVGRQSAWYILSPTEEEQK